MKWVRRIFMFLLIIAIGGSGFMAFRNFKPWRDAQEELDEIKSETFQADSVKRGFTADENQQSVAFVLCIKNGSGSCGSSYAIGDPDGKVQYFVTNGHVVQDHVENGYDIAIYFDDLEYQVPEVVFYQYDQNLDMAVLKIPEPISARKAVVIRDSDEVATGEKCTAIGYPDKSMEWDANFIGDINGQTVSSGVISKVNFQPSYSGYSFYYRTFQIDTFISHGNSGGPLLDENGFLIGMNTLGSPDSESVNFSIVSNEITAILDQEGIDYTSSKDYLKAIDKEIEADQKKFDKKHNAAVEEAETEVTETRNKFLLFCAIAAACAVVLLILFIVGNKKVVMVGEQDDGKKSFVYCTKGVFAGQKFEVTGQTMTIGRDQNSCTIVFPEDTPGISSNHCSIYFDARTKAFVLTDNGSTYGTYLSDGRKLTKGVPEKLLPGSTFALADKANEFAVDREAGDGKKKKKD
ncbi:MAG: trypsin-like peptidase domain-containing protein [Clostridiales bacterium]|nr:trypsin-like peptidase domain-containing protein [Clostridiales bacterium]